MKKRVNFYKIISIATSILFVYLFLQLFLDPYSFVSGLGLQPSETVAILCRRTSMFMLGLSILLFLSKNLPHSTARQFICLSTGITMLGLASMGSTELIRGTVNSSMLVAISIETILRSSFLITFFKNMKTPVVH
jgi:hypothetical protein